jgi:hypothetical protein
MSDRVEKFVAEFEAAIDRRSAQIEHKAEKARVLRAGQLLGQSLDELAKTGFVVQSITRDDVRALEEELAAVDEPTDLRPLVENARALLVVVEDGIVEGDTPRLRAALGRAEAISQSIKQPVKRSARSAPLDLDAVAARLPAGEFTVRDVADAIDRPIATARNYTDRLVEAGRATLAREDASGRGKPKKLYRLT